MSTFPILLTCGPKSHTLDVTLDTTIQTIKDTLSVLTKVRANNLLILFHGAFLEATAIIDDYEITENTVLSYEIKLCGPKPIDYDWSKVGVPVAPKKVRGVKKVTEL
jgi:hypothetical protein